MCPVGPVGADCPAEYAALQVTPADWVPGDVISVASLVGGIFGRGGGAELANAYWLQKLQADPADQAMAIYRELRGRDDLGAVVMPGPAGRYERAGVGGAPAWRCPPSVPTPRPAPAATPAGACRCPISACPG